MDTESVFQELCALSRIENIGSSYYKIHSKDLDYGQLLYLSKHTELKDPLLNLHTASAIQEQIELRAFFNRNFSSNGLHEKDFIKEGKYVEIEKLPRYVDIPGHNHDFFELACILTGECVHLIDAHESLHTTGDFTIIPPGTRHELHASANCICLTVKIRTSAFSSALSKVMQENSVFSSYFTQVLHTPYYKSAITLHCGKDRFYRETLLNIYSQQQLGHMHCDTIIESLMTALFSYILQNYQDTAEFMVSDSMRHNKMLEILSHIYENYQTVTLSGTAKYFFCSVPYLSSRIKKLTGTNFSELVRTYKLSRAADLLRKTDLKLDHVCEEIGYKDTAQFIKAFREKYGITPGRYRRSKRDIP